MRNREIREKLAAAYRIFALKLMDDLTYTHLSARSDSGDSFFIQPFGLQFSEVKASDLLEVSFDGKVISGSEDQYNSTGYIIHGSIYKARSDINSIFSYDLGINDIPRGRDHTQQEVLLSSIRNLLLECDQAEVITKLLTAAEKYPYAEYIEFQSLTNLGGRWVDQKKLK